MSKTVTIRPDDEYNADQFWVALSEDFGSVANKLRRKGEAVVSREVWERIQKLEGFADGPTHAPTALVVVG